MATVMTYTDPFHIATTTSNTTILAFGGTPAWSTSSAAISTPTITFNTTIAIGDVELTEETARKLVDLIEQLDRLDDSVELDAVAAGVAQEAECSKKEAKTTLVALRSLLSLASIERKLEAV